MRRTTCLAFACLTILLGLALRLGPWRVPLAVHHSGGGLLWGMILFALVAFARPGRLGRSSCIAIAATVAVCVECSRLLQTPVLDAVRRTVWGQLLLGQIFSPLNFVAYAAGIGLMAAILRPVVRPQSRGAVDPAPVA